MRILFCNYEYPPIGGGGGVVNAFLAEELAKRHRVTVLTSGGLKLPSATVEGDVRIIRVPVFFRRLQAAANLASMTSYLPMGIRAGRTLLAAESFDIINTHFVLPTGPVGNYLARFAHIPNVLSVHGGDLYDPSKWMSPHRHLVFRIIVRRLLRRADIVVGQSSNTLSNVSRYYIPNLNTKKIPLGIPRPVFQPASREAFGFTDDQVLLVTVGRLVSRKAIDQLIAMMHELDDERAVLAIIGSGPQKESLQHQAVSLGVDHRVKFFDKVRDEEKFQLLQMADLFVSTSQHEGFGLVFLEAMACGLPVVCYDFGGQTDFLADGVTGRVIHLNKTNSFTTACRQLIADPESRSAMGRENIRQMEDFFIDHCAAAYEKLFESVLKARHP